MATMSSFNEQCRNKQADSIGKLRLRFHWKSFRFKWGRYLQVIHPFKGCKNYIWWEWEDE